jgi:EAL domain-containing protein (putative c-di-GMP-specific phosphodiesterase class I)/GGDEF domain-containing protein
MIHYEIKKILPRLYNINKALWFDSLRKDYERYNFKVLLISFLATINIPVVFLIYDLLNNRYELIWNYIIPALVMILLVVYLIIFKNVKVMRVIAVFTAIIGLFCSMLLPGAHCSYIIILFNFIPLTFSLYGLRYGLRWSFLFLLSLIIISVVINYGVIGVDIHYEPEAVFFSMSALVIMFAILFSGQKQHEKTISKLVQGFIYDPVTELPNRDCFVRCCGNINPSIIAILHITNFKRLSILFGYRFTEQILIIIANALRDLSSLKEIMIYKLAWHEFGIQIPCSDEITISEARMQLDDILKLLMSRKFRWNEMEVNLSFYIGAVIIRDELITEALSKADMALSSGLRKRKSVTIYEQHINLNDEIFNIVNRYNVIYDNIFQDNLKSFLQPVVDTKTGEICWYESLLRIKRKDGEYESVWSYLQIAKDSGLYPMLTDFILSHAAEFLMYTGCSVSINLTFNDIINPEIFEKLKRISKNNFFKKGRLILEIVENEELTDINACIKFVREVPAMGVLIAIDDFGSGYSNLLNIIAIGADIIKIDGELIKKIEYDEDALMLISSLTDYCKYSGKSIVAEYIENNSIYMMVREMGIDYCQGYFFGKPEDSDRILKDYAIPEEGICI